MIERHFDRGRESGGEISQDQLSAMEFCDSCDEAKPQPITFAISTALQPRKALRDSIEVGFGNARAIVRHLQTDAVPGRGSGQPYDGALRSVPLRVLQQVYNRLREKLSIPFNRQARFKRPEQVSPFVLKYGRITLG